MTPRQLHDAPAGSIGALPGDRWVINGPPGELVVGDLHGAVEVVGHAAKDRYGDPLEFHRFVARDDGGLVAASIFKVAHLRLVGGRAEVDATHPVRSDSVTGFTLDVACSKACDVVVARDVIQRLDTGVHRPVVEPHVARVALAPDGSRVVVGCSDGRLQVRTVDLDLVSSYHVGTDLVLALDVLDDGVTAVCSTDGWDLWQVDLRSGEKVALPAGQKVIGLHRLGGTRFVAVDLSRRVRVFDGGEEVWASWLTEELGDRYIQSSALLPSGAGVVLACEQRGVWFQPLPR